MSGILDKIEQMSQQTNAGMMDTSSNVDAKEEPINMSMAVVISIFCLILSAMILISLIFAFSYDLCKFLDEYIIYIAGVIGVLLLISIYMSLKALKKRFVISILNIIFSVVAILLVIIPFVTGLLYF